MAEPLFDKEGNLQNADELTVDEVAAAYQEKNKQLFGRLTEAEKSAKEIKAEKDAADMELKRLKEESTKNPPTTNFATKEELVDIRLGNMGLDEETIGYVKALAKGKGIDPFAALNEPLIKQHMEDKKRKQEIEGATLNPSSRTMVFNDKPLSEHSAQEKLQILKELGTESAKNIRASSVTSDRKK